MRKKANRTNPDRLARVLFGATLILSVVASQMPTSRVWGFAVWVGVPIYLSCLLVGVGLLILFAEWHLNSKGNTVADQTSSRPGMPYLLWAALLTAVLGAGYYLLRGQTHFLGDGYSLVHGLAKNQPLVKSREIGDVLIHLLVRNVAGGATLRAAELSYVFISISAGVLYAVFAAVGGALLFVGTRERVLFFLGLTSGGYALMFFGYAENYSLFCVSILAFTLTGLLVSQGRISKWFILLPQAAVVFFHVLGLVFVPASVYLLVSGTGLERRVTGLSRSARFGVFGGVLLVGLITFVYAYSHNLFFRFAFVPLVADEFTVGGYTLLSSSHLADIINLLFVLAPGILMTIPLLQHQPVRKTIATRSARFLLVSLLVPLLAACVLDPKLGMARDWDLFSFPGVPLVTLIFWLMLSRNLHGRAHITMAILTLTLGYLWIVPRVVVQAVPASGIDRFTNYLEMDHARGRVGLFTLANYYLERGDSAKTASLSEKRLREYPCEALVRQAAAASDRGDDRSVEIFTMQALQIDPSYSEVWILLSKCYLRNGVYDSALMAAQVADGLNPNNWVAKNQMALAYVSLGDKVRATEIWEDLVSSDSTQYMPAFNLARYAQKEGRLSDYGRYLSIAGRRSDAPPGVLLEMASYHLSTGEVSLAAEDCRLALLKGSDTVNVRQLVGKSSQLQQLLEDILGK